MSCSDSLKESQGTSASTATGNGGSTSGQSSNENSFELRAYCGDDFRYSLFRMQGGSAPTPRAAEVQHGHLS